MNPGSLKERYLDFIIRRMHCNHGRDKVLLIYLKNSGEAALLSIPWSKWTINDWFLRHLRYKKVDFPKMEEILRMGRLFGMSVYRKTDIQDNSICEFTLRFSDEIKSVAAVCLVH